jgi:phosphodiesterase/alkaline phosphatase D-like protein
MPAHSVCFQFRRRSAQAGRPPIRCPRERTRARSSPHSSGGFAASEFVGGSITSQPLRQEFLDRWIKNNPHMHLAEGRWHGYGRLTLAPKDARVEFKALESEKVASSPIRTLAAYAVESGRPGVHPA